MCRALMASLVLSLVLSAGHGGYAQTTDRSGIVSSAVALALARPLSRFNQTSAASTSPMLSPSPDPKATALSTASSSPTESPSPTPIPTASPTPFPTPTLMAGAKTGITLTFTGDCTLGSEERTRYQASSFIQFIERNGFAYPFEKMYHIFRSDDMTIINMEGVFYDYNMNRVPKPYNFRAPLSYAQILPLGSIEGANIANNHSIDYGYQGFRDTVAAINATGAHCFGTTPDGPGVYVYEKDGVKVGLIAAYINMFGDRRFILQKAMEELKAQGCEAIVASMHGGTEYSKLHDKRQEMMADWFIGNGATVVIGHHPHVPHGYAIKGDASIAYSLGNFSFGGNNKVRSPIALIAQVNLQFSPDKRYLGHQVNLIPVSPSGTAPDNNYQPVLLNDEQSQAVIDHIQQDSPQSLLPYRSGIGAVQPFVSYQLPLAVIEGSSGPIASPRPEASEKPGLSPSPASPENFRFDTYPSASPVASPLSTPSPVASPNQNH